MRRSSFGVLAALLLFAAVTVFGGAGPARAASEPVVTLTTPASDVTWSGDEDAPFHFIGHVDMAEGGGVNVTRMDVQLQPADHGTHAYPKSQSFGTDPPTAHRPFDITITPAFNGKYTATLVGYGTPACFFFCPGPEQAGPAVTLTVTVAVPPIKPDHVKATLKGSNVTISWDANNKEADLLGYVVDRRENGGEYKCFAVVQPDLDADPPVTSYKLTDDLDEKTSTDNQYRIRSVRAKDSDSKVPTCKVAGTGIASASVSTGAVRYRSPSVPTTVPPGGATTTTKPGSGGGGGGGGGGGAGNNGPSSSKRPNLSALGGLGPVGGTPSRRSGLSSEPDTGFGSTLNYGDDEMPGDEAAISPPKATINETGGSDGNNDTLLYIAAGLLVTVLSMHVLWLKAQVDRMPLEPLAPE